MKKILLIAAAAITLISCGTARKAQKQQPVKELQANEIYFRDSMEVFTARCKKVLDAAYMAEKFICTKTDVPGWEGYPVELWEYQTGLDTRINQKKKGLVYLLMPSAEKLATWIVNAVYDATGEVDAVKLEEIRKFIEWQSGAQFAVSGVVYENMYDPGHWEPYIFKDGITVYIKEGPMKAYDSHCTEDQLQFYLTMTNDALKDYTGRYARISSTTREMYYFAGGKDEVGQSKDGERSLAYMDTIKKLYKEAWNSDRNFLIYAYTNWKYNHKVAK